MFGYKGKQVRDNIHSHDVACFIEHFIDKPRCGEVYNMGGGRKNSCSILEAFELAAAATGKKMNYEYVDKNREGDHICYISNLEQAPSALSGMGHHPQPGRHFRGVRPFLVNPRLVT